MLQGLPTVLGQTIGNMIAGGATGGSGLSLTNEEQVAPSFNIGDLMSNLPK